MAKATGLGAQLYVSGYDLSGDVGVVNNIQDSGALLDVTGIDKSAMERLPGLADGQISFTAFFNDATGAAHPVLKTRSTERQAVFAKGTTLGDAGAALVGKQVDYAGTRGNDGSLAMTVDVQSSNGDGLRWGRLLTAGKRTDTSATSGSSINDSAATSFGAVFFLQVFSFSGTDVTVKIQDSANNSAWSDVSGASFTAITAGPTYERIALATNATLRQYVRATTTTSGGFTSLVFAVLSCRRYAAF